MPVFGITGNLASGKSAVIKLLKAKGAAVFDADKVVHQCYRDKKSLVYKKVAVAFPEALKKGNISRAKLGNVVFSNEASLRSLERIVHPTVIAKLKKWAILQKKKRAIAVAEVPLLFEKKLEKYFDKVILVYAKNKVLKKRIRKKYGLSAAKTAKRLSLYLPAKTKMKRSDFIVNNSKGLGVLKKEVDSLWRKLVTVRDSN